MGDLHTLTMRVEFSHSEKTALIPSLVSVRQNPAETVVSTTNIII